MNLSATHLAGFVITLALIVGISVRSGRKVHSSSDFSVGGRKAGSLIVAGTIMGTLVGGASTIGTAQLAYTYGFSAWWFTLGAGFGCVLLAAFYAVPLRATGKETITQIIAAEYGGAAKAISGFSVSIGIFLNIIAQVLAGVALLASLTGIPPLAAAVITVACMGAFVLFGGVWGAGASGSAKTLLLYASVVIVGLVALSRAGGTEGLRAAFPDKPWFSLFGRGCATDLSAGFSLVIGVLSTQTYAQAVLSGRNSKVAVQGALGSAILIPPIGLAGIVVGLYMRSAHVAMDPAAAFPRFVVMYLPEWLAGIVLAALFVAVVGTGSGLALGIGVIAAKDMYGWFIEPSASDRRLLLVSRIAIAATLAAALFFITGNLKSFILEWSFLSMGLRGAAILAPLSGALFLKGRISGKFAVASILAGPLAMLACRALLPPGIDPLLPGIAASLVPMAAGLLLAPRS